MSGKSKALLPSSIAVFFILLAGLSLSKVNAAPTATYTKVIIEAKPRLVQLDESRKRKAKKDFEKMCKFLKLDEKQAETARKLFEARLEEMDSYLISMSEGKLDPTEAQQKMVESFKKYRKQFEEILDEKQKARLSLWEEQGTSRGKKNKAARG